MEDLIKEKEIKKPKITIPTVRKYAIFLFAAFGIFSFGYVLGYKVFTIRLNTFPNVTIDRALPPAQEDLEFSLFWKVWDILENKYFDPEKLIPSDMVYGAISGMVSAIGDPYTTFLPPRENKVVQEDLSGSFEGVGIQIGFQGTRLVVIAPLPESPAERAGVMAGDFIVGIKDANKGIDRTTNGITLPEAVQIIRGRAGTTVTLVLLRDEEVEVRDISIVREPIDVPSITFDYVGENKNIAHIKILKFVAETRNEWDKAIIDILKRPEVVGIIIDVRNNPGGFLQGAVDLASDFMEVGNIVVKEEDSEGTSEFKVQRLGRLRSQDNVVILINRGSASASEILAGALRDDRDFQLIGDTTFGKGTIQEPQQVDGGAGLHITIARWLTPSGLWVDEGGLVPDIEVEDNPDTEGDEQLQKAIEEVIN